MMRDRRATHRAKTVSSRVALANLALLQHRGKGRERDGATVDPVGGRGAPGGRSHRTVGAGVGFAGGRRIHRMRQCNSVEPARSEGQDSPDIPIVSQLVPHRNYVAECNSELSGRRSWSIPLTVIGAITVVGALFVRRPGTAVVGDV
ncbi:hypothetical protein I553_8159 [Mycobacterium xenopi 4042]|uniref:Uncharacterized protein n=1 Tax=Mycobacterium xenopi 4042 TaxID=1299334 RepID=X8DBN1_MYCXE|nr:hypothetical protein I553_8159 [Mycobacterium xenopi 4042]